MDNSTLKAVGIITLALLGALPEEAREVACHRLRRASELPEMPPDVAEYLKAVLDAATADPAQLILEAERKANGGRPRLHIIDGGDAA
jgi:hypothetical protein